MPVHLLAQSLQLQFAVGRHNTGLGKTMSHIRGFAPTKGPTDIVWFFYARPVHHDRMRGMPCVTQWKAHMGPQQGGVEVFERGANGKAQPSAFPMDLALRQMR